jgi:hypothetical protein
MNIWISTSYENIFKDSLKPINAVAEVRLLTVRNEYESAQINLRHSSPFTIRKLNFSDLVHEEHRIPAKNVSSHFVEYHHFKKNTPGLAEVVRAAPADFPDALSNNLTTSVGAATTQPIWITVYVPKGQVSGTYRGHATIDTTAGNCSVPIEVEVINVEIPDPKDGFKNAPMFALLYSKKGDVFEKTLGQTKYSRGWWSALEKMTVNAVQNRMNVAYIVQHTLFLDGGSTVDRKGKISLNWHLFDQYIKFYLNRGMRYIWSEGLGYVDKKKVYVTTFKRDNSGAHR